MVSLTCPPRSRHPWGRFYRSGKTFAGLFRRLDGVLARYTDDDLAIIVDFLAGARGAILGHVADLRAEDEWRGLEEYRNWIER